MKTTSIRRPLALLSVCAPVSTVTSVSSAFTTPSVVGVPSGPAAASGPAADRRIVRTLMSVDTPSLPQAHQVRVQAELTLGKARSSESYGTNGSTVKGIEASADKRFVLVARGVPPRGRPV